MDLWLACSLMWYLQPQPGWCSCVQPPGVVQNGTPSAAHATAQVNEFHNAPNAFYFTSPLNSSVLPTLRVSGEGVLTEFGFNVGRVQSDVLMVVLIGALHLHYFLVDCTVHDRPYRHALHLHHYAVNAIMQHSQHGQCNLH